jgi:hypothetical protein
MSFDNVVDQIEKDMGGALSVYVQMFRESRQMVRVANVGISTGPYRWKEHTEFFDNDYSEFQSKTFFGWKTVIARHYLGREIIAYQTNWQEHLNKACEIIVKNLMIARDSIKPTNANAEMHQTQRDFEAIMAELR